MNHNFLKLMMWSHLYFICKYDSLNNGVCIGHCVVSDYSWVKHQLLCAMFNTMGYQYIQDRRYKN